MSSVAQVKSQKCVNEKVEPTERDQSLLQPKEIDVGKENDNIIVAVKEVDNAQPVAEVISEDARAHTAAEKECTPLYETVTAVVVESASDKFDDLTSLEREIAEMHHVEPAPVLAKRVNLDEQSGGRELDTQQDKVLLEMQPPSRNATSVGHSSDALDNGVSVLVDGTDGLEHDDLIAVLKGVDHGTEDEKEAVSEKRATSVTSEGTLPEGVTIEGEGQFQIMEVIDDEGDEAYNDADCINDNQPSAPSVDNSSISVAVATKSVEISGSMVSLTAEEARAVAMEQIAGLNATRQQRRRKQDIKPVPLETDLVSSLGAEWSDDDTNTDRSLVETAEEDSAAKPTLLTAIAETKAEVTDVASQQKRRSSPLKITSVVLLQSGKPQAEEINNLRKENEVATTSAQSLPSSGFKRTRIIKRKIIWDPDAPETQFSFAQLVRGKSKPEATVQSTSSVAVSSKKEPIPPKKMRPITPKDKKLSAVIADAGEVTEKKIARSSTPFRAKASLSNNQPSTKPAVGAHEASVVSLPVKRRSQTPVANGSSGTSGKKKKITEIDRLMGDEGAINMLNALECERSKVDSGEQSDRPHKPLMRSRASAVTERVTKRDNVATTTAATKKDASPVKTKRNTKSKASSTWDYVYKQQANDDSMIIRRRSNSSYSSSASMHRLSLDGPASSKVNTKEASESSNSSNSTAGKIPNANVNTSSATITPSSKTAAKKTVLTSTKTAVAQSLHADEEDEEESSTSVNKTFEFAKPESKPTQKTGRRTKSPMQTTNQLASDMKKAATISKRAVRIVSAEERERIVKSTVGIRSLVKEDGTSISLNTDVLIKKSASMVQIIFNTQKAKIDFTFTTKMLNKLVEVLDKMGKAKDCNAVVLSTNAQHFCQGLDFSDLAVGSLEKRRNSAVLLATAVKSYLKTLATFPKPLIAAVVGNNVGLGVMQLPLFDIVIASDKATYETPYSKMGQIPEGHCIWNNITKVRSNFKTKLMWLCEKLNATEGAVSGLVNKITPPSKVNDDAVLTAKRIAAMPIETFRIMKKTTITSHLDAIEALDDEFDMIIEQWTAGDCYEHFKKTWELLTQG